MLEFEIYIVLCYNGFKRIENHFISCLVKDNKYEQFWYSINKSLKIPKQYSEAANWRTVDTMAKSKWINNDLQNITQKTKGQLTGDGQKKTDKQWSTKHYTEN